MKCQLCGKKTYPYNDLRAESQACGVESICDDCASELNDLFKSVCGSKTRQAEAAVRERIREIRGVETRRSSIRYRLAYWLINSGIKLLGKYGTSTVINNSMKTGKIKVFVDGELEESK